MAITVTHAYVNPVPDEHNPSETGPDEWNAPHTLSGSFAASEIEFTPAGSVAATDVQAAIAELDTEKLAASSYTAADVLAKLLTVDGSGSGLDADLLDGNSSAAFGLVANPLSQFAATTSAQLAGVISDETGTGALVFASSPTLVTPAIGTPASGVLTNCTGLPTTGLVDDAVTNAKLANMAQSTVKGRAAGAGTGDPTDLTGTQATAILDNFVGDSGSGGTKGLVPSPAAGDAAANKFLKADGTWAAGAGGLSEVTAEDLAVGGSAPPAGYNAPINLGLAVSAAASALTIALKGADGNDPSASNPVLIPFQNATSTTGTPTWLSITSANSLVLSSGSTLGVTSSTACRIWIMGCNDGGTFRIGAIKTATSTGIVSLMEEQLLSSTAEGGAGGADSAGVLYTGTAISSKACRILGYAEWTASGLTAGTWTVTNLLYVQLFGPGVHLPASPVTIQTTGPTEPNFGTTSTTFVATGLEVAITLRSAANPVLIEAPVNVHRTANAATTIVQLSRGNTDNTNMIGSMVANAFNAANSIQLAGTCMAFDLPNVSGSQTYAVQVRTTGGTATLGPTGSGMCMIIAKELMG